MSITVYCHRPDRLGARLKNFLYAFEFCKAINANLVINWPSTGVGISLDREKARAIDHDAYDFFDLFDENAFRGLFPEIVVTHLDDREMKELWLKNMGPCSLKLSETPVLDRTYFLNERISPIFFDITTPYKFQEGSCKSRKGLETFFGLLPVHPSVKDALADIGSSLDIAQAFCLHVRRGDLMNVSEIAEALKLAVDKRELRLRLLRAVGHFVSRYAPYSAYEAAIGEIGADGNLLVMSDNEAVKEAFFDNYGEQCLDYNCILGKHDLTPHQRDFVEFLVIANSGKIIGTESAFVDFASKVGGKEIINVLSFMDVSELIRELRDILKVGSTDEELFRDVINIYIDYFSRRPQLREKKNQLTSYLREAERI